MNISTTLKTAQALSETVSFFRFGFGLGDEPFVEQYGRFVADVLHVDSAIIDNAISVWSRIQTKFDAAAATMLHQSDNIANYAELKQPYVSNCLKAVQFDYGKYMNTVSEHYSIDNICAIKHMGYTYTCNDEIDKALNLFTLSAIWGDLFSINACKYLSAEESEKAFWDKLSNILSQVTPLCDNDKATKVAKAIKLLRLYDYKPDTIVRDAVYVILSDATLSDIDIALRARNFFSCSQQKFRIGFTTNTINTEDQNG